jgi:transposase
MNAPQCSVTTVTNVNLFEINLNFQFVSNKMVFSQEQKIYIVESYFRNGHLIDGEWQYSIEACFEEFRLQFPDAALTYNIFHHNLTQCIQIFRETGSVDRKKGSGRPTKRTEEAIANVRQVMEEAPRTSVRRLSQQVQLSTSTCHNILKKDIHLYPYRLQAVQQLLEADYPVRVEYCHWFLNTMNENLLNWSFFSDESWFYLDGYVNSQNMRWWSSEKPNFFEQVPLHPQKVGLFQDAGLLDQFFLTVQIP